MKKITAIFCLFLILSLVSVSWAQQVPAECPVDKKSLEVIDPKESKSIEMLKTGVMRSACSDSSIFSDVEDSSFSIIHNKLRCGEVDICIGDSEDVAALSDASEILKADLPKAVLLSQIVSEFGANLEYNIIQNRIQETQKLSICPNEKIEAECDRNIQQAVAAVGRKFLIQEQLQKKVKPKESSLASCDQGISLNKICQLSESRMKEISDCEKDKSKGCLNKEQKALAFLLNNHKQNKSLFLALEKQLCTAARIVPDTISSHSMELGLKMRPYNLTRAAQTGLDLDKPHSMGFRAPAGLSSDAKPEGKTESSDEGSDSPTDVDLIRADNLKINLAKSDDKEEVKGFEQRDGYRLSEQFTNSFNEIAKVDDEKIINNNVSTNSVWDSEFSNRFNSITEAEKKKKIERDEEEKRKLQDQEKIEGEHSTRANNDKKKNEEMNALIAQINGLKAKIEAMNANVDELKSKKETSVDGKNKVDKEALEREKAILDLKKKLTELEADKKKMQDAYLAKTARAIEDERNRSKEEERQMSHGSSASNFSNRDNDKTDIKREHENAKNAFNQAPASYSQSGAGSTSVSSGGPASTSGLLLKTAGVKASAESTVVYMTAGELQKYPYHLNANASNVEIEKMILGNNGALIILGNNEQIIPVMVNGVVQLDETGKVKYKRIKIALVKNERERKQNIAREIASMADLQHEEQRKRDLIRYREMKSAIKKATDKK